MPSTLATVMYNWMIGYRQVKGSPLTRQDYVAQWGDLGGAIYDWGNTLSQSDPNAYAKIISVEGTFEGQVDQMSGQYNVGGAMGRFYPRTTPEPISGPYGAMSRAVWDTIDYAVRNNGGISRGDLEYAWGELGGQLYDYMKAGLGQDPDAGLIPNQASLMAAVDRLANTYPPAGAQGSAWRLGPTGQGKIDAANLALLNQQIANAVTLGAFNQAQADQLKAQIANMPTVEQAQGLISQNLDNARTQGLINETNLAIAKANLANMPTQAQAQAQINAEIDNLVKQGVLVQAQADQIKAQIANMATPEMARAKFDTEVANLVSQGKLTDAQANLASAQTAEIGAGIQANPRDWAKAWFYQRNLQPPNVPEPGVTPQGTPTPSPAPTVPPWLQDIAQNRPAPAFSGQSGILGTFPIPSPAPNQISASVYNAMAPSEQAGLEGLASSSGWFWPDFIKKMLASQQRQPAIGTNPVVNWAGF